MSTESNKNTLKLSITRCTSSACLILVIAAAVLVPSRIVQATSYVGCVPNRTSDSNLRWVGWSTPNTYNAPALNGQLPGTSGQGSTGPLVGGVYSTITAYANYVGSTSNTSYTWQWVMLTNDLAGEPSSGARWAQIGPMTGPFSENNVQFNSGLTYAYMPSGSSQTNGSSIGIEYTEGSTTNWFWAMQGSNTPLLMYPGTAVTYTVLYNYYGNDEYTFWYNTGSGATQIGPTVTSSGWSPTQATVSGETQDDQNQMFGDISNPLTFQNTFVWQTHKTTTSWYSMDYGGQAAIGTTAAQGSSYVAATEFGWYINSVDTPEDLVYWDNACLTPVGTTSTTTGNGNYLDAGQVFDTQNENGNPNSSAYNMISPAGAANGPYRLEIQPWGTNGGNIIVYNSAGQVLWTPEIQSSYPDYLVTQSDGNLVLYNAWGRIPLWNSGTGGQGNGSYLVMQSDGNLVLFNSSGSPTWQTSTNWDSTNSALLYGQNLYEGSGIASENGAYYLAMQTDGNLVLYNSTGAAVWSTGTWNSKDCPSGDSCVIQLDMQTDGNLVLYSHDENTGALTPMCWAYGSYGSGSFDHMLVNENGTVTVQPVSETGGQNVWSSSSTSTCTIGGDL